MQRDKRKLWKGEKKKEQRTVNMTMIFLFSFI